MQKHHVNALMAGLAAALGSLASDQSIGIGSGQQQRKRRQDKAIVTDTSGYIKFHGTAPDGGEVNSWSGKLLPAKGKKPAAIKFIDGDNRVIGIMSHQAVREMAVAAAEGLKLFSQQDAGASGQQ